MTESQTGPSDDQLFVTLVADLVTQAWVALGKIKHPATDKIERSIPAAGLIIDMLDMLHRKTAGNRTQAEDRLLLDSLQQLKLNFIAEADKPEATEEKGSEEAPAEAARASKAEDRKETPEKDRKKKKSSAAKTDQSPKSSSRKK
ncbi:MAG: DUF1844 domain-containing protein [Calditrichaeota bacterium]|nr:DUF1844 domain-containing protein [Calditrichota bacterium]